MPFSTMDAVGLIGDAIGIIGFFDDLIPEKAPDGTAVTVKAGLASLKADESNHVGALIITYRSTKKESSIADENIRH